MEHISKTAGDVSEVVFGQPEEKAGATVPDGSILNRRKEEEWLEGTEPYHGARPRTTEVDWPVDEVLGATLGGKEENVNFRDILVPRLPPEQQLRQEEEVQTPPRREPRRNEGHQQRGPRAMTDGWNGVGPWGPGGPVDRYGWSEPTKRRVVTCSGIGEYSVTYAARSRGPADRKPIFEDAEGTGARASRMTGGTHDDKSTLV